MVEEVVAEAVPPQGGEAQEVTAPAPVAEEKPPVVAQRHLQPAGDRERCERLRMEVLKSISDPELHKFVSDMPGDDQTWLFYALIASASQTKEGKAINHIRDLINNQVVAAPKTEVRVDIKGEVKPLVEPLEAKLNQLEEGMRSSVIPLISPIEKKLMHVENALREVAGYEESQAAADESHIKLLKKDFQKLKDEVAEQMHGISGQVNSSLKKMEKSIINSASNQQKPNYMLIGIGLVCAMAFGLMTGITASRGLSDSDIRHIINQAAAEAAAQVQSQPNTPRR